jgi:hypothetical protein
MAPRSRPSAPSFVTRSSTAPPSAVTTTLWGLAALVIALLPPGEPMLDGEGAVLDEDHRVPPGPTAARHAAGEGVR